LYITYVFNDNYLFRRRLGRAEYLARMGKTIGAYEALVVNPERKKEITSKAYA
jgi:putative flippase GtrA